MTTEKDIVFEIGGRYRNRLGWYEILNIEGDKLVVRYEADGKEASLPIELQQRILFNISQEEEMVTPFSENDRNQLYFQTLGYITNNGFIEAIIPPKCRHGFDNNFQSIKGRYPRENEDGYYVHNDPNVDKWGTEMRLTVTEPRSIPPTDLEFGPGVNVVAGQKSNEIRINNNAFCWQLLNFGFNLGKDHDNGTIEGNIPEEYRGAYVAGKSIS